MSACRITCLYYSWAFWPDLQGDWPCTAFHRRWYSPSPNEMRWGLFPPQEHGHPPSQVEPVNPAPLMQSQQTHPGERGFGNAVCAHFLTAGSCVSGALLAVMVGKGHGSSQCCWSTQRGYTHIILLVSENEISVVMKFFRLNCPKWSHRLLCGVAELAGFRIWAHYTKGTPVFRLTTTKTWVHKHSEESHCFIYQPFYEIFPVPSGLLTHSSSVFFI